MNKQEVLKTCFGHDSFRPGQEELIDAVLDGRDALGIMPTGAGKSICYQVPALLLPGITLVISPLISLMKDQVAALKLSGVPAAYLNSSLTASQLELATKRACDGAYKIIYVAPERLQAPSFIRFARQANISLFAVDEAHCVSQWGQDFRPNYLRIAEFIAQLPKRPPVGAYTATATSRVREDIIRFLGLRQPVTASTGFDRPNLFFEVCQPKSKYEGLRCILLDKQGQSGIVYCATRKSVEEVTDRLREDGIAAGRYHAGLSDEERRRSQEDFQYDRIQVMVATNAFGMGIDKSNVSFVIHYNMPRSMEAYYQEAGRAGRDGSPADCILLYSGQDIITGKWLIEHGEPNPDLTQQEQEQVKREDYRRLFTMVDYCTKANCLREFILRYFGQRAEHTCDACSRCVSGHYPQVNGMKRPTKRELAAMDPSARQLPKAGKSLVQLKGGSLSGDQAQLFEALRATRLELSRQQNVPAYVVLDNQSLTDLAMKRPHSRQELLQVRGFGRVKTDNFGQAFLDSIAAWEREHGGTVLRDSSADQAVARYNGSRRMNASDRELLRKAYLNGVTISQLAAIHSRSEDDIRAELKRMKLLPDYSAVERYGVAAYEPGEDESFEPYESREFFEEDE